MNTPRILVAGLCGGGGKTLVSLGILAALRKRGCRVSPFKKGPDYIDAAWLTMAAGRPCRNLDLFLMQPGTILRSFASSTVDADLAVIEGNRGLYDGMDARGTYSTAELAKLLRAPVLLSADCTKSTRTVAAIVKGCRDLDADVPLRGVILNRTAGARHESILRQSVEGICGLPVLGAIPKIAGLDFPERHLGLVPPQEHDRLAGAIDQAAAVAQEYLDLEAILDLAKQAPALEVDEPVPGGPKHLKPKRVRIGLFRDEAFQFYYPENIEALEQEGAEVVEISPIRDEVLPDVDGLYIGGGFPETMAVGLSKNRRFIDSLRQAIDKGMPVYAECGGAVFLGDKLEYEGKTFDMAGVLPVAFTFRPKPVGHGYTKLETVKENPFFSIGETLRGHEFHYTTMKPPAAKDLHFAFRVDRGSGFDGEHDGLCTRNVLATYTHVHALGIEGWAPSLVKQASLFKSK